MKKENAEKRMTAPVKWNKANKVTCYYYGEKDKFGKALWYDENGNLYELMYARKTKVYSFYPLFK